MTETTTRRAGRHAKTTPALHKITMAVLAVLALAGYALAVTNAGPMGIAP